MADTEDDEDDSLLDLIYVHCCNCYCKNLGTQKIMPDDEDVNTDEGHRLGVMKMSREIVDFIRTERDDISEYWDEQRLKHLYPIVPKSEDDDSDEFV
jgi:hypothetical protein